MRTGYWRDVWDVDTSGTHGKGPVVPPETTGPFGPPARVSTVPPRWSPTRWSVSQTLAHVVVLLNYLRLVLQGHSFTQSVLGLVVDALDHTAEVRAEHPVAQRSAGVLEGVHRVQRADAAGLAVVDEPWATGRAAGHVAHHALVGAASPRVGDDGPVA